VDGIPGAGDTDSDRLALAGILLTPKRSSGHVRISSSNVSSMTQQSSVGPCLIGV
jgi:hypothetical protein